MASSLPNRIFSGDTCGEEERVLQHNAHLPPQALLGYLAQIVSINRDPAFGRIMKAAEQFHQGRFSGTGFPDQGDGLTGGYVEIDICQDHLRIIGVMKGHIFKRHSAVDQGQIECAPAGLDFNGGVQEAEDPLPARHGGLKLIVTLAKPRMGSKKRSTYRINATSVPAVISS